MVPYLDRIEAVIVPTLSIFVNLFPPIAVGNDIKFQVRKNASKWLDMYKQCLDKTNTEKNSAKYNSKPEQKSYALMPESLPSSSKWLQLYNAVVDKKDFKHKEDIAHVNVAPATSKSKWVHLYKTIVDKNQLEYKSEQSLIDFRKKVRLHGFSVPNFQDTAYSRKLCSLGTPGKTNRVLYSIGGKIEFEF